MELEWECKWNSCVKCKKKKGHKKLKEKNTHMDHEPSPLSNTKMPKIKTIAKLMDTYLKSNPKQEPPTTN
jgi:hypothetical protein